MESTYHRNLGYADYKALQPASSKPRNLKLKFSNEAIDSPVFTGQPITGKASSDGQNKPIELILIDSNTQQRITTGPEASATVKLVLVRADYNYNNNNVFSTFEESIVVDWKNKKNLLAGAVNVNLRQGWGTVGDIKIKHDRNAISNVRFRLGAMVVGCESVVGVAVTDSFDVKDRRNLPKKSRVLLLEDEVGRLRNVSRKRKGRIRTRLEGKGIRTVEEFLAMYYSNPQQLQQICEIKGKKWVEMVNHAKTCLDKTEHNESSNYNSGNIEFGINCYKPRPFDQDEYLIEDPAFSIEEYHEDAYIVFEQGQASYEEGMNGDRLCVGNRVEWNRPTAKKRWSKMVIFLLSVVRFGNKVGFSWVWVK